MKIIKIIQMILYIIIFGLMSEKMEVSATHKNPPIRANDIILIDNEWHTYDQKEMIIESGKLTKTLRVYGDLRGDNITLTISRNVQIYIYGNFLFNFGNLIFLQPKLVKYSRDSKNISEESFKYYINVNGKVEFNNISIKIQNPRLKNIIPKQFYFVGIPNQNNTDITRSKLSFYPRIQFKNLAIDNLTLNNIVLFSDQFFSVISIKIRNYCIRDFCHLDFRNPQNPRNVLSYSYILARLKRKKYSNQITSMIIAGVFATFIGVLSILCYILFFYSQFNVNNNNEIMK